MASVLPYRSNTNSAGTSNSTSTHKSRPSLRSFPSSKRNESTDDFKHLITKSHHHTFSTASQKSSVQSLNSLARHARPTNVPAVTRPKQNVVKSQYPEDGGEKHVEYILVASFDIDRGSVMEHQYPGPVGGDEHMLAELMLPDQAHVRAQDWTIFFLHKDGAVEEEEGTGRTRNRRRKEAQANANAEDDSDEESEDEEEYSESDESEVENLDGPPLVYVLNLVNTKQDNTVKRGAIVKAMAICTRHSFLHIYKPLLLLALQQYFAKPDMETLATLYDAVNSMDLGLMPRLSYHEKCILQSSDAKDLFLEKFEAIIAQRMQTSKSSKEEPSPSPTNNMNNLARGGGRYGLPRDTHSFESVVKYANVPVPVKIPVALAPETVGDFSLVKLISTFSTPHSTSPQPFQPTHPHLTTSGPLTHPIIVLLNALLTQKRIIFLGYNLPSSEVAEAVLGACSLASGGLLRGFTRHAFPYTDLTKIDDLLKVPGFIAGVTNPAFAHKSEWWDLLCDLSTGRMKISEKVEKAPVTEGVKFFQQQHNGAGTHASGGTPYLGPAIGISPFTSSTAGAGQGAQAGGVDGTGDSVFMASVLAAIQGREGEGAVRSRFRRWVLKFTRLAAAFEEVVYGATPLHIHHSPSPKIGFGESPIASSPGTRKPPTAQQKDQETFELPPEVTGHGYVWPTQQAKTAELAANATRIEGWRNTRSYYNFIQDLAAHYHHRPVKEIDLQHLYDKLAKLRLGPEQSSNIYLAICAAVQNDAEISQLLSVICLGDIPIGNQSSGPGGPGLLTLALGVFHPKLEVREQVAELLLRVREHEAGHHFSAGLGRFVKGAWERVMHARMVRMGNGEEDG